MIPARPGVKGHKAARRQCDRQLLCLCKEGSGGCLDGACWPGSTVQIHEVELVLISKI